MSVTIWKKIQKENFTCINKLADFLQLSDHQKEELSQNRAFPLNLPRRLAEKIQKKTLDDPILRQFVPLRAENEQREYFVKDPVGDCSAAHTAKYLQKYAGRVLLLTTGSCAMHCRYCFRQNYAYSPLQTGFAQEIELINKDTTIQEVILSGGDPLSLGNNLLHELISNVAKVAHVKRLRFHTRFPIGIPERIDDNLLDIFKACPLQIWFVIHCNHPLELDGDVLAALKKIQRLAIPLLNQFVLLKGVNDSLPVLKALCETLVDHGIMPYYMHQLDRVQGAAHFEVSQDHGRKLIASLNHLLAGYGVPKYVQEIASEPSKVII